MCRVVYFTDYNSHIIYILVKWVCRVVYRKRRAVQLIYEPVIPGIHVVLFYHFIPYGDTLSSLKGTIFQT